MTSDQVSTLPLICVKMPRRRGVSEEDRRRILHAYRDGTDYVAVARQLGVPRTTAWSVIRKWLQTGEETASRRGGNRPRKVDDEMLNFYQLLIEDDPTITLKKMNAIVRDTWPHKPIVSTATISRELHGSLITVKQLRNVPDDRNTARTKDKRYE